MRVSSAIKAAAIVGAAAVVAMIAAGKAIDFERYKGAVSQWVEAQTGRKLVVAGPLRLRLGLVPSLIAEKVSLSNAPGGSRPVMVAIDRVEAEIALPALLRKEILVQRLIVSSPDIVLENGNWRMDGLEQAPDTPAGTPTRFDLRELKIKNAKVSWHAGSGMQALNVHKLTVQPDRTGGDHLRVGLVADALGKIFEVGGKVGSIGAALAGKPWSADLKGSGPGVIMTLDGVVGDIHDFSGIDLKTTLQMDESSDLLRAAGIARADGTVPALGPMRFAGRFNGDMNSLAVADLDLAAGRRDLALVNAKGAVKNVFSASGVELNVQIDSETPAAAGRVAELDLPAWPALKAQFMLRDDKTGWAAGDVKASLGGSDMAGEAHVQPGAHPVIAIKAAAKLLDMADFIPAPAKAAVQDRKRVIPDAAVPAESLRGIDLQLALRADKFAAGGMVLHGLDADIALKKGRLSATRIKGLAGGGPVDATLNLDVRGDLPSASLTLQASGMNWAKATETASPLINAPISALVSLKARGGDLRQMAASASGRATISAGEGDMSDKAVDWAASDFLTRILAALNPLSDRSEKIALRCAVIDFRLRDGIAASDKGLALEAENFTVVGAGRIDLRDESLDLAFTPRATEGLGISLGGKLADLTRLGGTLAAPETKIDELGLARTALSAGAAAATGGLSLLGEALFDRAAADPHPCETARGGKKGGSFLEDLFGR